MGGEPVYLNIYDLSDQNSWTYWCGVGIFHSGLEVYGVEYAYGGEWLALHPRAAISNGLKGVTLYLHLDICYVAGHEYDVSGVFATNPKDAPGPGQLVPAARDLSPAAVMDIL